MIYFQLGFEFFKAGLFAIGGGLATLPYLMQTSLSYPDWYSIDELMQMVAVSESTPGPIGINVSSYVGFHVAGVAGALVATLSLVLPSFITILILVRVLDKFRTDRRVAGTLESLRPASTGLIGAAGFLVLKSVLLPDDITLASFQWSALAMFVCLLTVMRFKRFQNVHPIVYFAVGAVLGIVFRL